MLNICRRFINYALIGLIVTILTFVSFQIYISEAVETTEKVFKKLYPVKNPHLVIINEKRAYAMLLSTNTSMNFKDVYFTSIRVVIYKLLHDPQTRTGINTDLIIIVTDNVAKTTIDRLREDGAIVRHVQDIKVKWARPNSSRWVDQFTKLRLWEMIEWDSIMYLDSDMIISKNLDGWWLDPATMPRNSLKNVTYGHDDELLSPLQ